MRLIFATNNNHKLNEIKDILGFKYSEVVYSLADFNINIDPEENGHTFDENANIKSTAAFKALKENNLLMVGDYIISDDTGLLIDYLNGAPGLYSARFMGDISQKEKNTKIIDLMKDCEDAKRTAHFETHLSVIEIKIDNDIINMPTPMIFIGKMNGYIAKNLEGTDGFGYDPIFAVGNPCNIDKKITETYASIGQDRKNKISHRANALKMFVEYLEKK